MSKSSRDMVLLSIMVLALSVSINGCRKAPIHDISANPDQRVEMLLGELNEIVIRSEPYRLRKQEELNKAMAQLVPIMRIDFSKKLGRDLGEAEQIRLTKITRETLDEAIDDIVMDSWKQYFLRYVESDELEELYKFHKTPVARKFLQMAMDSQRIMSNDASDESMRERYISSFAKKLKNEDPSLYSALFPLPSSPIGGKEEPCSPNIQSLLGPCFEFTTPQDMP